MIDSRIPRNRRNVKVAAIVCWAMAIAHGCARLAGLIPDRAGFLGGCVLALAACLTIGAFLDGGKAHAELGRRFDGGYRELQETTATVNALCEGVARMFEAAGEPLPAPIAAEAPASPILRVVDDGKSA